MERAGNQGSQSNVVVKEAKGRVNSREPGTTDFLIVNVV